ncbi:MAG TPA: efflux RND transporter periplasmic adaptor subunit [Desulfomonilia bacterium]
MEINTNTEANINEVLEIGHKSGNTNKIKRWVIIAGVLVVLVIVIVIIKGTSNDKPLQYKTEKIVRNDLIVKVTATGTLEPTNEVEVGSELSGTIKKVLVDYNDRVKAGQPLAEIDTTKLKAEATQTKASLESALAKVEQAQATLSETRDKLVQYQNVRKLSNNKVPSQTEMNSAQASYDRAKADLASAKAAVSETQAKLDSNLTDLSKAIIRSPINGVILKRDIEPGQTVAASYQTPVLFTLAEDLTKMELHVNVDEADIGKIKEGQDATFTVSAYPNRIFTARITKSHYGSSTTSGVVTYETVLKVDNSDLSLRPGMTVTADIKVNEVKQALLAPTAALRFVPPEENKDTEKTSSSGGLVGSLLPHPPKESSSRDQNSSGEGKKQQVWIVQDGSLKAVPVKTGATNGNLTEIISTDLKPGTAVVVDTITKVK